MLKIFELFRKKLDDVMLKAMGKRVVLYGYDRTGQFMEWLEYMYGCNFVQSIYSNHFEGGGKDGRISYVITTQKEIFPILDKCHCIPQGKDAIFDFGCGKGGAMLSFLDYGFQKVGGVEYEKKIYDIMLSNFEKLGIHTGETVSCIHGDAVQVKEELDDYNWFYYFAPFKETMFVETIRNITASLERKPRKIHIISIIPTYHDEIVKSGRFVLTNQFWIATRQKVVDVFVSKEL